MGSVKALLVGVCEYPAIGYASLPLCKNDLFAVRTALINGLNINPKDILLCGEHGTVSSKELLASIVVILSKVTSRDTFIFYFTGHGGKNCLALSDGLIPLQDLIDVIENTAAKNKVVILDSCHSGDFSINKTAKMELIETVENFAGHGYAVLASCGAEQMSGFNDERQISLYTGFLIDAIISRFLIKKGKKSLEAINEAVFQYAAAWNRKGRGNIQQPIFRSNIGGTIFFNVEDYNPYKVAQVYEETDKYIIYKVEPMHHGMAKRLSVKVILRYESSLDEIADISLEIKDKVLFYEVHQNAMAEARHKNQAANIVWCFFGYDEDDMINPNFICHTTWVDDAQEKSHWYREKKNSSFVNGAYIEKNSSYDMIKKLMHGEAVDKEKLIAETRELTARIISAGEEFIKYYREYCNGTINEEQLIEAVVPLNKEISAIFLKQGNLPVPPKELHDWANAHTQIAGSISDFSLYYDRRNLDKWSTENRKYLMNTSIKRYETDLEALREIEKTIIK